MEKKDFAQCKNRAAQQWTAASRTLPMFRQIPEKMLKDIERNPGLAAHQLNVNFRTAVDKVVNSLSDAFILSKVLKEWLTDPEAQAAAEDVLVSVERLFKSAKALEEYLNDLDDDPVNRDRKKAEMVDKILEAHLNNRKKAEC